MTLAMYLIMYWSFTCTRVAACWVWVLCVSGVCWGVDRLTVCIECGKRGKG